MLQVLHWLESLECSVSRFTCLWTVLLDNVPSYRHTGRQDEMDRATQGLLIQQLCRSSSRVKLMLDGV